MQPTRFPHSWFVLIGLVFASCASKGSSSVGQFAPDDFHLVLLRTGPEPEASTEELFQRHFAFMKELAEQGKLLIAGPFGPDKHEPDLRGIFILDEASTDAARALAAGDPPSSAGVFRQEIAPLITLDVIRALPAMETQRQRDRLEQGIDLSQPDVRAYTILTAPRGDDVFKTIFQHPAVASDVVLVAKLGGEREGELFAILDVRTADEARRRLAIANESALEVFVDEWYGSPTIAELARGGGPPGELDREVR